MLRCVDSIPGKAMNQAEDLSGQSWKDVTHNKFNAFLSPLPSIWLAVIDLFCGLQTDSFVA